MKISEKRAIMLNKTDRQYQTEKEREQKSQSTEMAGTEKQ